MTPWKIYLDRKAWLARDFCAEAATFLEAKALAEELGATHLSGPTGSKFLGPDNKWRSV